MVSETPTALDLALAHRLADEAALTSLSHFRRERRGRAKGDGGATDADIAVEDRLRAVIGDEHPSDAVLGEGRGQTKSSGRRWIVKGIDGTLNFGSGAPDWGTLVALEVDGQVVVSVCDQPAQHRRYWASKGHGAFRTHRDDGTPTALGVSVATSLSSARGYVPPQQGLPDEQARMIASLLACATCPRPRADHPVLQTAGGGYEIGVLFIAGPWDLAGPSLILEEAGGRLTDLSGHRRLTSGHALFSNGLLHDEGLRLVSVLLGGLRTD